MKFILFFLLSFSTVAPVNDIWEEIGKNIELKIINNDFTSIHRYDSNVVYIISELPSVITYQRLTNIEGQGGKHSIPIMANKSILSPENEDSLQKLYSELTKDAHEVIYIYIRKLDFPFITDPNEIYRKLNDKAMSDNGPRLKFGGIIKDIDKVYDITDDTWNNFLVPGEYRNEIRIGLTVDDNLFHIFTIDKNEINYTSLLGEMDPQTYKFISNFKIDALIKRILEPFIINKIFFDNRTFWAIALGETQNDVRDLASIFELSMYYRGITVNKLPPHFMNKVQKIYQIMRSLTNSNLLKIVITRILTIEESSAKVHLLEYVAKANVLTQYEIDWLKAYDIEMASNEVCNILHSVFLQNIVKKLVDFREFYFRSNFPYVEYIMFLYLEIEKYVEACETVPYLRCDLLTDYRAIETNNVASNNIKTMSLIRDKALDIIKTRLINIMGDTDPKSLRFHQLHEGGEILMNKFNNTKSKTILFKSGSEDKNMLTKKIFHQLKSLTMGEIGYRLNKN